MKLKICKVCGSDFVPYSTTTKCCSVDCALKYNRMMDEKNAAKAYRKETRKLKNQIKTKSDWVREAQTVFNRYIRERDVYKPCISCGRHHQGQNHAGHYRTTRAAPNLRFHEMNCFLQCQPCNTMLSGNITEYRINLVKRIGQKNVEWIESQNSYTLFTIEELKEIKKLYKEKYKWIKSIHDVYNDWAGDL